MMKFSHKLRSPGVMGAAKEPTPAEIKQAVLDCPFCQQAQMAAWKDCPPWAFNKDNWEGWHRHLPGPTFETSSAQHYDPKLMAELKDDLDAKIARNRQRALGGDAGIGQPTDERQAAADLARTFGGSEAEQLAKIKAGKVR
jgi:hypothetical protein